MKIMIALSVVLLTLALPARGGDFEAAELSRNLQRYHLPSGMVAEILTTDPSNKEIIFYEDVGDAALWTGFYLAAESFRYAATRSPEALEFAKGALRSMQSLLDAPGTGYLARSIFRTDDPYVDQYVKVEGRYGLIVTNMGGQDYYWQMGVTRDQYCGVFFGLSIAYDFIDDPAVKAQAADIITRLTDYLLKHAWTLQNPDSGPAAKKFTSTFLQMPQQKLSILQVARHVNPKFKGDYERERFFNGWITGFPIWLQTLSMHSSYFKFNLENTYIYNLVRLEERDSGALRTYKSAHSNLRNKLRTHGNPLFNMIDREVNGPDAARDAETRLLLEQRLALGFRHRGIDLRGKYPPCGDEKTACDPVPTPERAVDGFMWQRDPTSLYYEGDPRIEGPGIDYLLPYWMARVYGVL